MSKGAISKFLAQIAMWLVYGFIWMLWQVVRLLNILYDATVALVRYVAGLTSWLMSRVHAVNLARMNWVVKPFKYNPTLEVFVGLVLLPILLVSLALKNWSDRLQMRRQMKEARCRG